MSELQNTTRIEIVFSVVSFITPGLLYLVYASLRGFAEFDRIECWLSIVQELALCKTCIPVPPQTPLDLARCAKVQAQTYLVISRNRGLGIGRSALHT